jgi:alanine racemase
VNPYRVWAEIDLDALAHNLGRIRLRAGPGVRVMLVVKADAYGHGAVAIAHHAMRCGIGALGVGTSAEALELRHAGLLGPMLVLGTIVDEEAPDLLRHRVEIGIHSGDRPERALPLLERIAQCRELELAGIMTHISSPRGALDDSTRDQMASFCSVLREAEGRGLATGWIHAANSAALFTGVEPRFDTVRPGISAYGILPGEIGAGADLRPVMALKSQIVFLKDVPEGAPVGYGSTWRAPRTTRIATLPVGYNDGVSWRLGNRGEVLVRGQRAPIAGTVSMDYTTIDVGHVKGVQVGDTVTLFGGPVQEGADWIGVEELARRAETIPYEITCSVGKRVRRLYQGGHEIDLPRQLPRGDDGRSPDEREASASRPASSAAPPA